MAAKKIFRIVPVSAKDWKVMSDSHVFSSHNERDDAVDAGVHLARKEGNALVVIQHYQDFSPQK